jgi:hypothetical protein
MAFAIQYAPDVEAHFHMLVRSDRVLVLDSIFRHLVHQPLTETEADAPESDSAMGIAGR